MNSEEIFTIALSLEDPWFIKEVKFDTSNSRLDIYLGFTKGYRFATEGDNFSTAHDTVERNWQHLNFFSILVIYTLKFPESNKVMVLLIPKLCLGRDLRAVLLFCLKPSLFC